ncbi:hypothetical protein [Deinococcus sp.]|uniref:hypothetical protein n=1 Tax=Deinococcus sp. TaxID=47478 RepID=UPI00391C93EE
MSGDRREWLGRLIPGQQVAIVRVTLAPHRGDIATQDVQLATVQGVNGWHATVGGIRFRLTARGGEPGTSTTRERLEPAEHAEFLRLDSRFRAALSALKGQAEHSRLWSALERVPLGMDVGVVTPEIVERLEAAVAHLETIRALQVQLQGDMETIGAELYQRADDWWASLRTR